MTIHHEVLGRGTVPLICVHGWCCHSGHFLDVARMLSNEFRIHLIDLPGHGQTGLGSFLPTFENYTNVLLEYLDAQTREPCILAGHSMGGCLALLAGARRKVRAIVNLDGAFPSTQAILQGRQTLADRLSAPNASGWLDHFLRETFFEPQEHGPVCDAIIAGMLKAPESVRQFLPAGMLSLNPQRDLPGLEAPALFVGSARPRFDEAAARRLNPRFQFARISSAGHFLPVFAAKETAELIRNFARMTAGTA